jgi:hypothetical protein
MSYESYQRTLLTLAYAREPQASALPDFALYRSLIRTRLFAMARLAFKQSWAQLGEAASAGAFAAYLEQRPPTSPLIREVIAGFAAFVAACPALLDGAPAQTRDLLQFEAAKWRVASALWPTLSVREVDFEGALVLNPTLELLALDHGVGEGDPPAPGRHTLLVYRRPATDDVRWYRSQPLFAEVLARGQQSPSSLAQLVTRALAERGEEPSEASLHEVAGALAIAVERGVVLGVAG